MNNQRSGIETPDETTPHMNAHIGGNQVTGFDSCSTSRAAGNDGPDVASDRAMSAQFGSCAVEFVCADGELRVLIDGETVRQSLTA